MSKTVTTYRDPVILQASVPPRPSKHALVLGLDLGTSTGFCFAYHDPSKPVVVDDLAVTAGQLDLSAASYESGAIRFVRLRQFLSAVRPDAIFYEHVRNTPTQKVTKYNAAALLARAITSAQLFGAFQAHVAAWAEEFGVPCSGFGIGEIKKRATGKGNADKVAMIEAANKMFGLGLEPEGYESSGHDNVADASIVCLLGLETYGAGVLPPNEDDK